MKFFTAGDVLRQESAVDLTNPVTIDIEDTIQEALTVMFKNNFSQLPVLNEGQVSGVVTYKSISRMLKAVPNTDIRDKMVKGAMVQPYFVNEQQDLFDLFETFAVDEYVLIGSKQNLNGILTRYDVFYFLKDQFEPFIQIGEIEQSLRELFRQSIDNVDERIYDTFSTRAEEDPSYSLPDSLDHFNFEEYKRFIVENLNYLPSRIQEDSEFVLELLEQVRQNRNALFHFRAEVEEIDRDTIEVAHSYFTGLVG